MSERDQMTMTRTEAGQKRYFYKGRLRSVYDGDTIRMDIDLGMAVWRHNISIRLWGINTPEIRSKDEEEKKRGYLAKNRLMELLADPDVYIETIKDRSGKYGRVLGIIWAEHDNGILHNANLTLVLEGHAEPTEDVYREAYERHMAEKADQE